MIIDVKKLFIKILSRLDNLHPVGSIYISVDPTSPSELFGGTWERLGVGRTLISAGGGENPMGDENTCSNHGSYTPNLEYFPVGETGGELFHTLTVAEMPSHNHQHYGNWSTGSGSVSCYTQSSNRKDTKVNTGNTGDNRAHNTMQPYLAVYMWKRTA